MTLEKTGSSVRIGGQPMGNFQIGARVIQGDPLSTLFFILVLEKTMTSSELNTEGHLLYKSHQAICYVDDMDIIVRSAKNLKLA